MTQKFNSGFRQPADACHRCRLSAEQIDQQKKKDKRKGKKKANKKAVRDHLDEKTGMFHITLNCHERS